MLEVVSTPRTSGGRTRAKRVLALDDAPMTYTLPRLVVARLLRIPIEALVSMFRVDDGSHHAVGRLVNFQYLGHQHVFRKYNSKIKNPMPAAGAHGGYFRTSC